MRLRKLVALIRRGRSRIRRVILTINTMRASPQPREEGRALKKLDLAWV